MWLLAFLLPASAADLHLSSYRLPPTASLPLPGKTNDFLVTVITSAAASVWVREDVCGTVCVRGCYVISHVLRMESNCASVCQCIIHNYIRRRIKLSDGFSAAPPNVSLILHRPISLSREATPQCVCVCVVVSSRTS